jgi:hypothetical protein
VPFLKELFEEPDKLAVECSSSASKPQASLHEDATLLMALAQPSVAHRFAKKRVAPRVLEEDDRLDSTAISKPKRQRKRKKQSYTDVESG